jgi:hypothetical protein
MTQTLISAGLLNAAGAVYVPAEPSGRQHVVQGIVTGTGALTGTVDIGVSLDGGATYAPAATSLALSGSGVDSKQAVITCDGCWVKATVSALTGTGAAVKVLIS